jgi:hypothetical protein
MRRAHRSVHRGLWPVLALVVGFGLALALVLRAPAPSEPLVADEMVR